MNGFAGALPFRTANDGLAAAQQVSAHLEAGGLIAYPTETVYGLGGECNQIGVNALNKLKGRSAEKTVLLLVSGNPMIESLNLQWTPDARELARKHWPGPLTLILRVSSMTEFPHGITGPQGGVAIRWTSHPAVQQFLQVHGRAITSTSANVPGADPATATSDIVRDYEVALRGRTLMLLDGGELPPSPPSTVIDCTASVPRVLRHGAIQSATLRATIPELIGNE